MKADHGVVNQMLKTARGQLDGVLKMVEEDRYCVDISTQLLAIEALLKKTNKIVLHAHLKSCVSDSFITGVDVNEKIDEVLKLLDKFV
ncbi:MAG: metal-sensing transcriptional repressor [Spirochaetales bacterium]|nr:metal-sensing transcriptional repressor [Spirochaetales bacterium]